MKNSFLLEIGSEEIPARFIDPALQQMKNIAIGLLNEKRVHFHEVETFGTPRRLGLLVIGMSSLQELLLQEVKGPALKVAFTAMGEPTRAAEGFAKSQGVDIADLIVKPVGPVEYVFAVKKEEGRPTAEILGDMCLEIINSIHFPKPMRWGNLEVRFARPVRWLLALNGSEIVDFEYAGLKSGRVTYGHRFLSKGPIELASPEEYTEKLESAYVMADPAQRRRVIREQILAVAGAEGGAVEEDDELLDEVTNLVEWPTALCGRFDESFLRLPKEVLVTPMREHQRYFPVVDASGGLLPKFIAVRNGTADHLDIVRTGNEKVLRARLSDASFFWDEDLKTPLSGRVDELKKVVWQESLGTVYEKMQRITGLGRQLATLLNGGEEEVHTVERAGLLSKADLVTGMVYEFPELQGIMGREYALRNGEGQGVAEAVFEHYLPRFAGDRLPGTLPGMALSLAEKMDTLVGCFAIGIQPTGSQDPYALRRQALGICHMILEGELVLSLRDVTGRAYDGYVEQDHKGGQGGLTVTREDVLAGLEDFFAQRLRGILAERGYAYDTMEAVLAAGVDDIYGVLERAGALAAFRQDDSFAAVLTAFSRAYNLAKKYDRTAVDGALFESDAERQLYKAYIEVSGKVNGLLEVRDFAGALKVIGSLRTPVDFFFESIMVMVEDERIRDNRLALLKNVAGLATPIADLCKIVTA